MRQERASTISTTLVTTAKGAAGMIITTRVTCNIASCKTTKSTHSTIVVTRRSAGLFLPQHNSVAGYLNMQGTATVAFLAAYMATGNSNTMVEIIIIPGIYSTNSLEAFLLVEEYKMADDM